MIELLDAQRKDVIHLKATGKLTKTDYETLLPEVEKVIKEHGKVSFLIQLEDVHGWEPGAAWEDLRFDFKHGGKYERCAVVGEKKWQEWMTKLSKPFFTIKYFEEPELQEAWRWLQKTK